MAKKIGDKTFQSNFDQLIVRFWFSLSYLITTVKFAMRLQQSHGKNQSGHSLNIIMYGKVFSLQILAMISCVFVKL